MRKLTGKEFPAGIEDVAPGVLAGLGSEYAAALQGCDQTADFITDKLPHNFLRLGFFLVMMPHASIVVCERDPADVCLSIYQHYFVDEHGYATDLSDLAAYFNMYTEMIAFWDALAPGSVVKIPYEDLVRTPETEIRRLLDHCGLGWHADCLSFHKTDRIVETPSSSQVRKPPYTSAIGRSAQYEEFLEPLLDALAQKN